MREQSETAVKAAPSGATGLAAARPQSLWRTFWHRFCRHRLALLGMTVLMVLTLSTLLGPLVYHHRINDIDFAVSLQGPSLAHPLGTDDLGQDLLARILYGGRVSMAVGLVALGHDRDPPKAGHKLAQELEPLGGIANVCSCLGSRLGFRREQTDFLRRRRG